MTSTTAVATAGAANPDRTVIPVGTWAKRTLRFAIAVCLGAGVAWLAYSVLPDDLSVRTDIVGYPIHHDYLPQRLLYVYAVWVVAAPLIALGAYALLGRLVPWFTRPSGPSARLPLAATPVPVEPWPLRARATAWARIALVGGVLGFELTTTVDSRRVAVIGAAIVVQLLVVAAVGRVVAGRLGVSPASGRSLVSALTATLGFLGLWVVSRNTSVFVSSTGRTDHYPWMPLWLAILGTLAMAIAIVLLARRDTSDRGFARIERSTLLLLVGPLLIFLVVGGIPGEPALFDNFEEGQLLAGAQFLIDGLVPWRDMILTHGVLQDGLVSLPGLLLFGGTRWGATAGTTLLMVPLAWIGNYYLAVYLFRRNLLFLAGTVAILVVGTGFLGGLLTLVMIRFLLLPYALLLFAALLKRPTWPRAVGFTAVLFVQVVLAPELAMAVPVFAAVLVAYEWTRREPGTALVASFARVARCVVSGIACMVVFALVLVAIGAFGAFIDYFTTFVGSHLLTGALPVQKDGTSEFTISMVLPIALVLLSFWFVVARFRSGRGLRVAEWVMTADAAIVLVYYSKFLVRPDRGHVAQVFAVAVPLTYYVVYRLIRWVEQLLIRARTGRRAAYYVGPHWVTAIVLLAILVPSTDAIVERVEDVPTAFRPAVAGEPFDPRLGYSVAGADAGLGRPDSNLRQVLDAIEGRDGKVWDFSNSTATVSFLLHEPLVTRYPHVTIAESQSVQADLIGELRDERPEVVVYDSFNGLTNWDGISNQVRHYEVSSYLLNHYRPFVSVDGYLLFVRDDLQPSREAIEQLPLTSTPEFDNLYFGPGRCDWGTAPHFFDQEPTGARRSDPLPTRDGAPVVVMIGHVPPTVDGARVAEILAVDDDANIVGRGVRGRPRLDIAPTADGFEFDFGVTTSTLDSRLFARLDDGTVVQLAAPDVPNVDNSAAPFTTVHDGEESLVVRPIRRAGLVEHSRRRKLIEIDLPDDAKDYEWLEIESDGPLAPDVFELSDTGSPLRSIAFRTLPDRDDRYRVRVGSCAAWHGYPDGAEMLLLHDADQSIERVRLLK